MAFHVGDKVRIIDNSSDEGDEYHYLLLGSIGEVVSDVFVAGGVPAYFVEGPVSVPGSTRTRSLQQLVNASDLELIEASVEP